MFTYIIISAEGLPLFQYPTLSNLRGIKIDSLLFSSLMSALNTFSVEATGSILGEVNFGSVVSTMSKDEKKNLHVVLTDERVPIEMNKRLHIEIKALLETTLRDLGVDLNSGALDDELLLNSLHSVLDPFRRHWEKLMKEKAEE